MLLATKAAAKHMVAGASIINIGSVVSEVTPANSAVYSGTKGAVDAITGVLAKELGPRQIRVNAVNPEWWRRKARMRPVSSAPIFRKAVVLNTPLGRIGQPSDIAAIAVFLASDQSGWMTGEKLVASGGMH